MSRREIGVARRGRFFYGWVVLAVSFLCNFVSGAISVYTLGLFLKPMTMALGWTRAQMMGASTTRSVVGACVAPVIGYLADKKYGARLLIVIGGLIAGGGLMLLSRVTALWQWYVVFGMTGALGMGGFGMLVTGAIIPKWFIRKRGRAMAIVAMGMSTAGIIFVPLTQGVISAFGWRTAWIFLGLVALVLVVIPGGLFMRRRPEDMGLMPDGVVAGPKREDTAESATAAISAEESVWTLRAALRTPTFWFLIAVFNIAGLTFGVLTHMVPHITDVGFSETTAATILTTFAIVALAVKLPWGFITERIDIRYCRIAA